MLLRNNSLYYFRFVHFFIRWNLYKFHKKCKSYISLMDLFFKLTRLHKFNILALFYLAPFSWDDIKVPAGVALAMISNKFNSIAAFSTAGYTRLVQSSIADRQASSSVCWGEVANRWFLETLESPMLVSFNFDDLFFFCFDQWCVCLLSCSPVCPFYRHSLPKMLCNLIWWIVLVGGFTHSLWFFHFNLIWLVFCVRCWNN